MRTRRTAARIGCAAAFLGAAALTGCGSSDGSSEPPAICSDVEALKASMSDLKEVKIGQGGLAQLQDDLAAVQSDLNKVIDDAKSQYTTEVDAVKKATSSLGASLEAATATPSGQTITAVGTAVQALGSSVTDLGDAVTSTC